MNPISEWFVNESVGYIDEPLPRKHLVVLCVWQVLLCDLMLLHELEEFSDSKSLVLRNRQVTDLITVDKLSIALNQSFEKVNRVALVRC